MTLPLTRRMKASRMIMMEMMMLPRMTMEEKGEEERELENWLDPEPVTLSFSFVGKILRFKQRFLPRKGKKG